MHSALYLSVACVGAGCAALFDLRSRRIPNWLCMGILVVGLSMHLIAGGWRALLLAVASGIGAGTIFFLFFLVGGMGAGDVKLIAALAAMIGPKDTPPLLLFTALAGGLAAMVIAVSKGKLGESFCNTGKLMFHHAFKGMREHSELNLRNKNALSIPYAVPVAIGTFVTFYLHEVSKWQ